MKRTSVDGQGVGDLLPQPHRLLSVKQEVDDPSDGIEDEAKIHKQDHDVGSCSVQMLEDEVEGHVYWSEMSN